VHRIQPQPAPVQSDQTARRPGFHSGMGRARAANMADISDRLLGDLVDAVKDMLKKEQSDRLRDVYLIGDIDKDSARTVIERTRELANDSRRPIRVFINSAGGNVTDGLALHDALHHLVLQGYDITIIVQGMAYSMGSIVLQAASPGRRLAFPHSWIMIHEPAKWAGWQSTTAAAQHLDRLKQMQAQIYRILADRSGKPLRQIIRDTKRTDFYLDAASAREYGLIDDIIGADAVSAADQTQQAMPPRRLTGIAEVAPSLVESAPAASEVAPNPPVPDRLTDT
jgi:ATP-dependent Clp protease, protease subunit